ncbi:hypothetical protein HN911_13340 [Candidatus Bathyarchaeota archaeon]|jgi:hypothetical protein|nr:hypothetical protein [Candidatus Bathyarchaeota archaeon]
MKYLRKSEVVEAWQWRTLEDGPEGIVQPFEPTDYPSDAPCAICTFPAGSHGKVETSRDHFVMCPGDVLIQDEEGRFTRMSPVPFFKKHEALKNDNSVQTMNRDDGN